MSLFALRDVATPPGTSPLMYHLGNTRWYMTPLPPPPFPFTMCHSGSPVGTWPP